MKSRRWKKVELKSKQILTEILLRFLPFPDTQLPGLEDIHKVLVFRLDQRIGNGIMLLPLIRSIRRSLPNSEVHLLVHEPIAQLLRNTYNDSRLKIWPYQQEQLLRSPWILIQMLRRLRALKFDVILSCHNPDNFSFSQALLGRWCRPNLLVGFHWRNSPRFYDCPVKSTPDKHYTDSLLDLWRVFDPEARLQWGGLRIPEKVMDKARREYPETEKRGILFWVGAKDDKQIPATIITVLSRQLKEKLRLPIVFAAGPEDNGQVQQYPPWICKQTRILNCSLVETAAYISSFQLFMSGDTGPMHLAVALGVPTLTIFRETNIIQYGYHDGENHFSVRWDQESTGHLMHINKYIQRFADKMRVDV